MTDLMETSAHAICPAEYLGLHTNVSVLYEIASPTELSPAYVAGQLLKEKVFNPMVKTVTAAGESVFSFFNTIYDTWYAKRILAEALQEGRSDVIAHHYQSNSFFYWVAKSKLQVLYFNENQSDEKSFQEMKILMDAGVRTEETMYWHALRKRNKRLIALLNAYEINPDPEDYEEITRMMELNPDLEELIEEFSRLTMSKKEYEQVVHTIDQQRDQLSVVVDRAIVEAKESNKPLLLLVGEAYRSFDYSLPNELLLLELVSEKLPVGTVMTEATTKAFFSQYFSPGVFVSDWVEDRIDLLGMRKVPIDLFFGNYTFIETLQEDCDKSKATESCEQLSLAINKMKKIPHNIEDALREEPGKYHVMAKEMIRLQEEGRPMISIVEAHYLYPLIANTYLSTHYHISPINFFPEGQYNEIQNIEIPYLRECYHFLKTPKVFSVPETAVINKELGVFVAPNVLNELTRKPYTPLRTSVQKQVRPLICEAEPVAEEWWKVQSTTRPKCVL